MNNEKANEDLELYRELNAAISAYCISRGAIRDDFLMTLCNDIDLYFGPEPTLDFSPADNVQDKESRGH